MVWYRYFCYKASQWLFHHLYIYTTYTSKIKDLCSNLNSKEMLQNFLYLYKKKIQVVFFSFFILSNFHFYLINALVYVNIDQGIHNGKNEICSKWKAKKLIGFSFYINIKNFEAFFQNLNLSTKHLFWRCDIGGFQFQNWFSNSNLGIPRLGNWLL